MKNFNWSMDFINKSNQKEIKVNYPDKKCYLCGKEAAYRIHGEYILEEEDRALPYWSMDDYICQECAEKLINEEELTYSN